VVAEGGQADVAEFVRGVKRLRWQEVRVRGQEDVGDESRFGSGYVGPHTPPFSPNTYVAVAKPEHDNRTALPGARTDQVNMKLVLLHWSFIAWRCLALPGVAWSCMALHGVT
jgi:hypothetical protein